jgi:hypothetical protein
MAKVLDLNNAQRPTLEVILMDDARTLLRVTTPTESVINEFENLLPELGKVQQGDRSAVDLIYDLTAKILSCNRDFIKVTAEELRGKYRMDLETAIIFWAEYNKFIDEIKNAKN